MIDQLYEEAVARKSDLQSHLHILRNYATQCDLIVELGFRHGLSATAFLATLPKRLHSIDWNHPPFGIDQEKLAQLLTLREFTYQEADSRTVKIPECDLLFIDTWHTYDQLFLELMIHADQVRTYILIHDTLESQFPGMTCAVEDFVLDNPWKIEAEVFTPPGLIVLERTGTQPTFRYSMAFRKNLESEIELQQKLFFEDIDEDTGPQNPAWHEYVRSIRGFFKNQKRWPRANQGITERLK